MKLTKVRIKNFKSIEDSKEFNIDDKITCLVGKNQAGKTALLEALNLFDLIQVDPNTLHPEGIELTYTIEDEDCQFIKEHFGDECLKDESPIITIKKELSINKIIRESVSNLSVDIHAAVKHIINNTNLPEEQKNELLEIKDIKAQIKDIEAQCNLLSKKEQGDDSQEEHIDALNRLKSDLQSITQGGLPNTIYHQILRSRTPKFLYTDEYYEIQGKVNLTELQSRIENNQLHNSDHPLRRLIDDTTLQKILKHDTNDSIMVEKHIIEKDITDKANKPLEFWSKNKNQQIDQQQIDVEISHEPPNWFINIMVRNTRNDTRVRLVHESNGFQWFYSFLLWYQQLLQEHPNLILLLDEPALSLHGTAQEDILACFEADFAPKYQIIYTAHSPFMIDINNLDRVRVVENLTLEQNYKDLSTQEQGTKVTSDILQTNEKSILPIQSVVGFNINQIHGIGQNVLIVEGESDILYINTMSELLQKCGRRLNTNWERRSANSIDKVENVIKQYNIQNRAIGKKFNIVVLTDYHQNKYQTHENINKELKKNSEDSIREFFTYKDFVDKEADVEDIFTPKFYLKLVSRAYNTSIDESNILNDKHPRIDCCLKEYFKNNPLPNNEKVSHKKTAEYFKDNIDSLEGDLCATTRNRFQKLFDTLNNLLVPQTSE